MTGGYPRERFGQHDLSLAPRGDVSHVQDYRFPLDRRDRRGIETQTGVIKLCETVAQGSVPAPEFLKVVLRNGDFPADMPELVHFSRPTQWQQQQLEPKWFQIAAVASQNAGYGMNRRNAGNSETVQKENR